MQCVLAAATGDISRPKAKRLFRFLKNLFAFRARALPHRPTATGLPAWGPRGQATAAIKVWGWAVVVAQTHRCVLAVVAAEAPACQQAFARRLRA